MPTKEKLFASEDTESKVMHRLILFNDEVNTFDHVVDSLMEICRHSAEQAEQCAMITHYKGKCAVMNGEYREMEAAKNGLDAKGLSTEIH